MHKYVLGFLFSNDGFSVALIRKNKPEWQKGRLNGIGGKVEPTETYHEAMVREFEEETGVHIPDWEYFGDMLGEDWIVALYVAKSDKVFEIKSTTDEEVSVVDYDYPGLGNAYNAISNVPYLVHAARDCFFNPRGPAKIIVSY